MELITGGTGIVGAHVLLACTAEGRTVKALRRTNSDVAVVERIFRHYRKEDADVLLQRIQWVEGDLHDMPALLTALDGVTHVYHAAALVSFDPRDDQALMRTNAVGTANLVNACLERGVRRLCHVSSTATIGSAPEGQQWDETLPWAEDRDTSPYAASKYQAELEVYRGIAEGLDAVIVNPCIVIGPGAAGRSSMTMVERVRKGIGYYPPGSNAVVDARDVASCMLALMEQGGTGERYLLVGENLDYRGIFSALAGAFGKPPPTRALPAWLLDLAWRLERLRTLFGGRPLVTRHTAHSAVIRRSFSNEKVSAVLGHRFRHAAEMAANVAAYPGLR
jgi:dihydroflavonol-4-reductase